MLDAEFGRYECNQLIRQEQRMKILMVLTSHDQLGNTGRPTGFWLEEFAAPYFVFRDAGVELTLASPKGGQPPIDPKSDLPENQRISTRYSTLVNTGPCGISPRIPSRSLYSNHFTIPASRSRWSVTRRASCVM